MRWRRGISIAFFIFLVFLPFFSLSEERPLAGGQIVVALPGEPPGLDPTTEASADVDRVVYSNVHEGLVKLSRTGAVIPGLAERWEVSKDGKTYTFYLRRNVKFHDGRPFTAEDVKDTMDRNRAPGTRNIRAVYFKGIEQVTVLDKYRVRIQLAKPDYKFILNLTQGESVIFPRGTERLQGTKPIGTGPFRFVEWIRGDRIVLARFEHYYKKGIPYLDRVVFRFIPDPNTQLAALKAGDVDVIGYGTSPEIAYQISKDPKFKVLHGSTTTEVILSTNNSRPPFNDVRVRRAMAYGIDRKALIEAAQFGYGTPIGSHMSPIDPSYVDLTWLYPYNPERSRALLAEAGYPNGFKAVLKLPPRFEYAKRTGEVLADMLGKVGIELKIELIEWGQWIDRVFKNADYDLTVIGHAEAFDIDIYAQENYYFRYRNLRFNEVIERASTTADPDEARKLYAIAQWIIAEDAVNVFLYSLANLPVMKKEIMNWWKDYPTVACDVTEVYRTK